MFLATDHFLTQHLFSDVASHFKREVVDAIRSKQLSPSALNSCLIFYNQSMLNYHLLLPQAPPLLLSQLFQYPRQPRQPLALGAIWWGVGCCGVLLLHCWGGRGSVLHMELRYI